MHKSRQKTPIGKNYFMIIYGIQKKAKTDYGDILMIGLYHLQCKYFLNLAKISCYTLFLKRVTFNISLIQ